MYTCDTILRTHFRQIREIASWYPLDKTVPRPALGFRFR